MMTRSRENRAGPFLGAALIGCGIGYLIYNKTGNLTYGIGAAVLITAADYVFVMAVNKYFKKDK